MGTSRNLASNKIDERVVLKAKRVRVRAILDALAAHGPIVDSSGLAMKQLTECLDRDVALGSARAQETFTHGDNARLMVANTLNEMIDPGWVKIERRGKRTFRIELGDVKPDDWSPGAPDSSSNGGPYVTATGKTLTDADIDQLAIEAEQGYDVEHLKERFTGPGAARDVVITPAAPEVPDLSAVVEHAVERVLHRAEDEALGMRAGRLGARIEARIPELVQQAVNTSIEQRMHTMLAALGYFPGTNPERVSELEADNQDLEGKLATARATIERLNEDAVRQQAMIDWLNDQEEKRLRGTNDGQIAQKGSLTPSQVPDVFRRTAEYLLQMGWTIHRTRGSHLMWRSPGPHHRQVYSASTPGDPTVDQILWRKLYRLGVPKIPYGWSPGDPVPEMNEALVGGGLAGGSSAIG